jgi:hypothetical protein
VIIFIYNRNMWQKQYGKAASLLKKLLHLMLSFINISIIILISVSSQYRRCKILSITEKIVLVMFVGAWCTIFLAMI